MSAQTFAVASLLLACVACQRAPVPPMGTSEPLEIGYSALRISLPLLVADSRGLFAARGLRVHLTRYETAQPLVSELLDGRLDAGGYAALPIIFTAADASHKKLVLLSAMIEDEAHPVSYLLKRRGDTTLTSLAELRDRRIGVLPTLAYKKWLVALLQDAGLNPSQVNVVPLAPPQQVSGLTEGVVDALFTNDPMATSALAGGSAELLGPPAPLVRAIKQEIWFGSFAVSEEVLRKRPQDIEKLCAALDEAIDFVHADPANARQRLAPYLRESERAYVDKYPPARYLKSSELNAARLTQELALQQRLGAIEAAQQGAATLYARKGDAR